MANTIIHKHSCVVNTDSQNNKTAKLPAPSGLTYGEIAINYAQDYETISFKNEVDEIVEFKSDKYYDKQEEAIAILIENLQNSATTLDSEISSIKENYITKEQLEDEVELTVATSISDLSDTVNDLKQTVDTCVTSDNLNAKLAEYVTAKDFEGLTLITEDDVKTILQEEVGDLPSNLLDLSAKTTSIEGNMTTISASTEGVIQNVKTIEGDLSTYKTTVSSTYATKNEVDNFRTVVDSTYVKQTSLDTLKENLYEYVDEKIESSAGNTDADAEITDIKEYLTETEKVIATALDNLFNDVEIAKNSINYPIINHETTDIEVTLSPNTMHIWGTVESLTLSLGTETKNIANEYVFQFTSGDEATSVTLPNDIKWAGGKLLTIKNNTVYQVSILNNLGSFLEFS